MSWFRKNESLPLATHARGLPDGSGKAIHMDAPIVKAWKNSSNYIKGSYYLVICSLLLMIGGYRQLRHSHASIWLTCHAQACTLEVSPPRSRKTITVVFDRSKLQQAQSIKVTKENELVGPDTPRATVGANTKYNKKKKAKRYGDHRGPDTNGHFDSYTIRLVPEDEDLTDEDGNDNADWSALKDFSTVNNEGFYTLSMRQFNLGKSRRSTRTMVNRIDSYIKQRRHKVHVKENSSMSWKGILCMVFGLFAFLLTLLLGQFWEETDFQHTGGPGARRRHAEQLKKKKQKQQQQQQQQRKQPRYSGYPYSSSQPVQSQYKVSSSSSSSARPVSPRGGGSTTATRRKHY